MKKRGRNKLFGPRNSTSSTVGANTHNVVPCGGVAVGRPQKILFGLGAAKAGTTWLHAELGLTRGVHTLYQKEIDFWNTHYAPYHTKYQRRANLTRNRAFLKTFAGLRANERYDWELRSLHAGALRKGSLALTQYYDLLSYGSNPGDWLVDITPNYQLVDSEVLLEMQHSAEQTKFIYILRDPVDRAWSAAKYFNLIKGAKSSDGDVAALGRHFTAHVASEVQASQVQRAATLMDVIPEQDLLILFYEDLHSAETEQALSTLLGIQFRFRRKDIHVNKSAEVELRNLSKMKDNARDELRLVYEDARELFGARLPRSWASNMVEA
jgi:hypothetical protein